jgi:hypothetical protein
MRKAQATYNAPEGDAKEVEMGGVHFRDGESVELNTDEHEHLINKMQNNPHFDIEVGEEEQGEKRRPGRPRRDLSAGIAEARDHDFEADRRANLAGRKDQEPDTKPASAKASAE